ncbi:MAG: hypothetical protein HKN48_01320, partial [Flavobacteriaceae bacterium]|nr:hypothetical protein [Flavobacteriaceae bacterium]
MSKAKFHIIAILMSLMWNFSYGQKFTNYSIKEGLPSNHVYRLTQDKQGFIWIITDKGIVRFNGKDVKTFTTRNGLPTNDIWGIGITADQKIWFFSKAMEVGYIDRDSVVSFPSEVKGEVLNPVVQYQTKERMGFASNFESYHLNNKRWQKVPPLLDGMVLNGATLHPKVAQILIKRAEDSVYFVDKTGRTIRQKHLKSNLLYSNLRGQLNDSLFFWTNNSGYLVCNLNTLEFYNRSFLSEINKESVNFPRFHEVNSEIQLTGSGFVAQLDSSFRVKKMYEVPEAINSHFSFVDRDETLWMATFSKGVYKFPRRKREIAYDLLDEKISELNNLEGAVVASVYDKGFYTYNASQKNFNPLVEENGYILSAAHFEALNSSFFLTGKKIIRKKEGAFKEFHTGDANFKVNTLARNLIYKESYLYGIYSGGINKIDPETLKVVENYPQVGCYSILDFKGNIYLGTPSGIKVLSDKSLQEVNFENLDFDKPILKLRKVNNNEFLITTDGFGAYTSDLTQIRQLPETNYLSVQDAYVDETD